MKRTLAGRTIIVTRTVEQAEPLVRALERRGARVLIAPTIRIVPARSAALTAALKELADGRFEWITLTSRATVDVLRDRLVSPRGVRAKTPLPVALPVGQITLGLGPVRATKIFRFAVTPNHPYNSRHPVPRRGALAIVTNVGAGCGGRGSVRRVDVFAGRLIRERTSRADERRLNASARSSVGRHLAG